MNRIEPNCPEGRLPLTIHVDNPSFRLALSGCSAIESFADGAGSPGREISRAESGRLCMGSLPKKSQFRARVSSMAPRTHPGSRTDIMLALCSLSGGASLNHSLIAATLNSADEL